MPKIELTRKVIMPVGIRKNGSCTMPFSSTVEPIRLKATIQPIATTIKPTLIQMSTLDLLDIFPHFLGLLLISET